MGKSTSYGLKRIHCAKDKKVSMAPQKILSSRTVLPGLPKTSVSELDFLVQDINKKGLDAELQNIIDNKINKNNINNVYTSNRNDPELNYHDINPCQNESDILRQNHKNGFGEMESELQGSNVNNTIKQNLTNDNGLNYMQQNYLKDTPSKGCIQHQKETTEAFIHDHSYALSSDQLQLATFEDDIDICSHGCTMLSEGERFQRPLENNDNNKINVNEPIITRTLGLKEKITSPSNLLSPSSSTSSLISENLSMSLNSGLSVDENDNVFNGISSPESSSSSFKSSSLKLSKRSAEKWKTHTNGSSSPISPSILQLESFFECKDHINNIKHSLEEPQHIKSAFSSQNMFFNGHPLLQSPSPGWDRSEAGFEIQDDSSELCTPLRLSPDFTDKFMDCSHAVFHDHDYFAKAPESISTSDDYGFSKSHDVDNTRSCGIRKRKYTFKKRLDGLKNQKIKKAKHLKKELLKQSNPLKSVSYHKTVTKDCGERKASYIPRPRKRQIDKMFDEDIEPEDGSKLKITGKYQDQFVYYLSKSSRTTSRRRQSYVPPSTSDTIILPAPSHGDILIPHLTDADIEAVRLNGRGALNIVDRPYLTSASGNTLKDHLNTPQLSHSSEFPSDVDSHIVSTILSMENESLASSAIKKPYFIDTTELNPDQPALTESLRIMSGDSTITSEHVLNYLLSLAKDEGLLESCCQFGSNDSSQFLPIQADSTVSGTEHAKESERTVSENFTLMDNADESVAGSSYTSCIASQHKQSASADNQTLSMRSHPKDATSENDWLDHNLSSALPESTSEYSLNTSHSNSSNSVTDLLKFDDFSSLEKQHHLSFLRSMSLEKTFDYLYVNDNDVKLERDFDVTPHQDADSNKLGHSLSSSNVVDDTPWIVTVTLYCNDVPAIIINNQPYIRLVDIHKQILPAKDTGILKKRCQLLSIPVLTCTEMQRYFLVQYGRAYNSKSSLVISKDHATDLLKYYVTPRPRAGRGRIKGVHQYWRGRSQNGTVLPVTHRRFRSKRSPSESWSLPVRDGPLKSPSELHQGDTLSKTNQALQSSFSQRTRHNKISYIGLLKGENRGKTSATILERTRALVNNAPGEINHKRIVKTLLDKKSSATQSQNNTSDFTDKKYFYISKNGDSTVKSKSVQKRKVSKSKIHEREQTIKRENEECFNGDSRGNIEISRNAKLPPLKLKLSLVKFAGRGKKSLSNEDIKVTSNNSTNSTTTDRPLRVFPVAHQTALSGNTAEAHLPSQPAYIHLDMFLKSNSACVRCATCSQFLSVPHFMQHHHVPLDVDFLVTEAAQRVLVPRNKENISHQEKQLWAEFLRLQAAFGGFGEADDDDEIGDIDDECTKDQITSAQPLSSGGFTKVSLESPASSTSSSSSKSSSSTSSSSSSSSSSISVLNVSMHSCVKTQANEQNISRFVPLVPGSTQSRNYNQIHDFPTVSKKPVPVFNLFTKEARSSSLKKVTTPSLMKQDIDICGDGTDQLSASCTLDSNLPSTRTSNRKRKSKQLFSIENYYTPRKWDTCQQDHHSMKSSRT